MSGQATTQQFCDFLIAAIQAAVITGSPPANYQATYDTEAPEQSPLCYVVVKIEQNPINPGFFDGTYSLRAIYTVQSVFPRKLGAGVPRGVNDKIVTAMHSHLLTGFVSATTECLDRGGAAMTNGDAYVVQSVWQIKGDNTLS